MMKKKITKFLTLVLSSVMISSFAFPVMASSNSQSVKEVEDALIVDKDGSKGATNLPPKDKLNKVRKEKGSITIELTDGKSGTSKQNVEFALTKVADLKDGFYVMDSAYESQGIDLNNIKNASDLEEAATKLTDVVGKDTVGKTDINGRLPFKDLEIGVYLLQVVNENKYDEVTPLLISIPTWSDSKGDMMYDVKVVPKHTPKPEKPNKPETPRGTPQTDLNSPVVLYFGGAILLGIIMVIVNLIFKNVKKRA